MRCLYPSKGINAKWPFFILKSILFGRKSVTKFLCVKSVGDRVVRYSLFYLTVQKWLVGDVPFYLKF